MIKKNTMILCLLFTLGFTISDLQAQIVSVNLATGNSTVSGTLGALPAANWNNEDITEGGTIISESGGLSTLFDNTGTEVIGMAYTWAANAAYNNGSAGSGGNTTLLYGGIESQTSSYSALNQIDITGITYAEYDLYLYVKGWTANREGEAQLVDNLGDPLAGTQIGFDTYQNFPGTHIETDSTADQGTYILWQGLQTANTFIQFRNVSNNIIIAGFQVHEVPEPSTYVLLSLVAIIGLGYSWRKKRTARA